MYIRVCVCINKCIEGAQYVHSFIKNAFTYIFHTGEPSRSSAGGAEHDIKRASPRHVTQTASLFIFSLVALPSPNYLRSRRFHPLRLFLTGYFSLLFELTIDSRVQRVKKQFYALTILLATLQSLCCLLCNGKRARRLEWNTNCSRGENQNISCNLAISMSQLHEIIKRRAKTLRNATWTRMDYN